MGGPRGADFKKAPRDERDGLFARLLKSYQVKASVAFIRDVGHDGFRSTREGLVAFQHL